MLYILALTLHLPEFGEVKSMVFSENSIFSLYIVFKEIALTFKSSKIRLQHKRPKQIKMWPGGTVFHVLIL